MKKSEIATARKIGELMESRILAIKTTEQFPANQILVDAYTVEIDRLLTEYLKKHLV